MKTLILILFLTLLSVTANAKPRCQGFNNYDNKVTIVFSDETTEKQYRVSDVKPITSGKVIQATSIDVTVTDGAATVKLTFPHLTHFSNPKVTLRVNGKKTRFKVCQ
ncbi:MAG: hypothetical protein DBY35_13090 [Bacteroidales bacterium]|nr:MAG: hypothetical protein DBY35_13090 [Bacteroidales bacterium]